MSRAGFTLSMCLAAVLTAAAGQQTFRTHVDLVHFGVAVTDKAGVPIMGLTAEDFEIKEAGKPQTIVINGETMVVMPKADHTINLKEVPERKDRVALVRKLTEQAAA